MPPESRLDLAVVDDYFLGMSMRPEEAFAPNTDPATVAGFGREWRAFSYEKHDPAELDRMFDDYFAIFPWEDLPAEATGFDAGCGSGRWAMRVAPRVGHLHCIDASAEALEVATRNLAGLAKCSFHHADVSVLPFPDNSMDFGYSLGVLHHVPDPDLALQGCVRKLKLGAPFLLYFYYALENRPHYYRALWRATDATRRVVAQLPYPARYGVAQAAAAGIYFPLARMARFAERLGVDSRNFPLAAYRNRSFYVMRNDALDRFGTALEHRRTREEIESMMLKAGLQRITFRDGVPYWVAVGHRAR